LLGPGKPLRVAFESGRLHSMILWGPPGVGKTTLARLAAQGFDAQFIAISAVLGGVKDIRDAVERAQIARNTQRRTFVDEVHRFNKAQQDAFLPHVESGLFTFIGATTVIATSFPLVGVCDAAELYPDIQPGKAVFRRSQLLGAALMREGLPPLFMSLSEEEQLLAGNSFMRKLAAQCNASNPALGQRQVVSLMDAREELSAKLGIDLKDFLNTNLPVALTRRDEPLLLEALDE
jgi:hypothetical protein